MRICGSSRSSSGPDQHGRGNRRRGVRGDADVEPRQRGFRLGVARVVDVQRSSRRPQRRRRATGRSRLARFRRARRGGLPRPLGCGKGSRGRGCRRSACGWRTTVSGAIRKRSGWSRRSGRRVVATMSVQLPTASAKITSGRASRRRPAASTRSGKRQQKQPPVT